MLLHGRMFLTNRHVCFYSNLFGFEKKLVIPMESVTRISKGTTLKMLSNAVRVFTRDNASLRECWRQRMVPGYIDGDGVARHETRR